MKDLEMVSVTTSHPLETVFDVEPNSTVLDMPDANAMESGLVEDYVSYDAKDDEIDKKFDTIYKHALTNAASIAADVGTVEGKYKAQMGDVVASNLNVALAAAAAQSRHKLAVDKLTNRGGAKREVHTTNNNLVVTSQTELVAMLLAAEKTAE